MEDKEMEQVVAICKRLEPIIHRFIEDLLEKNGGNVAISVVSNLSTSFMAQAITMMEMRGADVDQFVTVLMHETKAKYTTAKAQVESELAIHKMMTAGNDTCRPLH